MKKSLSILLIAAITLSMLAGCGSSSPADVDFNVDANSSYKHINNGGITSDVTLPYNIDAITGATLTVEGPAVETSIPLSIREIENLSDGIVRGQYKDSRGIFTYEGLDIYHLVHNMVEGDNGIILTDTAYDIVFKNANREEISRLTLKEIEDAHNSKRPVILAYGIGTRDGSKSAPFVFDGSEEGMHSLGYESKLKNDDGCIKLVYDNESFGNGTYNTFVNTAYVYVCEETTPGFKHTGKDASGFGASRYVDAILTFRGEALGREYDLTTTQLENLVTYDGEGNIIQGGIGYSDWYSLANNAYWYVNEYEGLQLYELLQYLGMQSAEEMGTKAARTTIVKFIAGDGVPSNEVFSVDALSYPDAFGFYKKNAQDAGDGTFTPSNADLVRLGYPVLLSYGVNDYPYTISKTDSAYISGLSNSGGPFRVVFGKKEYAHANGSNQVQQASEIIVGNDVLYNTHQYTDNAAYKKLAASAVRISVKDANGKLLSDKNYTVGEIESEIYGEDISLQNQRAARRKDTYECGAENAVYEGIDIEYLFMNVLSLPGMNGRVTVKGSGNELTMNLEDIFKDGFNTSLQRSGLSSILAFAKNGSPLVSAASDAGYEDKVDLKPFLDSDPKTYEVDNQGGPLKLIVPSSTLDAKDAAFIDNVEEISIELIPDSYAHIDAKYAKYQSSAVKFFGPGLEKERTYTVSELESKQTMARTADFSMLNKAGTSSEARYRGLALYDLFKEIGINNNAGDVTVSCSDGSAYTYSLMLLKKSYENFINPGKDALCAMLAYGSGDIEGDKMQGTPFTDDGPLMLIVPQENADSVNKSMCLKNVVSIYVDANEVNTWSHSMSDVFSEFLDYKFTVSFKNDDHESSVEYTLAQLEAMEDIIIRDTYTVLDMGECEGVDLWKLIRKAGDEKIDLSDPVSITVYAEDGYKNDLLSNCFLRGFTDGIESENGDVKRIILGYAIKGFPIVDTENHEGYTGIAGNCDGPIRVIVEGFQGGSLKMCNKVVVTLPGSGEINL